MMRVKNKKMERHNFGSERKNEMQDLY